MTLMIFFYVKNISVNQIHILFDYSTIIALLFDNMKKNIIYKSNKMNIN